MQQSISTAVNVAKPLHDVTMSSRDIAEVTGKEHFHVLRDIRTMLEDLGESEEGYLQSWIHPQNGQT
ncbi:UNVERIFIED_ORG: phage regulator Rha-like protein [Buttiauxella agrestis ATCC 33320]